MKKVTNWYPSSSEIRDGDDLERCRRSRNAIVHKGNTNFGNEDVLKYFKSFKNIARRLEKKLKKRNNEFFSEIEFLEECCMDEETEQKYLEELRVYKVTISQLKGLCYKIWKFALKTIANYGESDCCLTPSINLSPFSWREQGTQISMRCWWCSLCTRPTCLTESWYHLVQPLWHPSCYCKAVLTKM
jgi:hypothetical protein